MITKEQHPCKQGGSPWRQVLEPPSLMLSTTWGLRCVDTDKPMLMAER